MKQHASFKSYVYSLSYVFELGLQAKLHWWQQLLMETGSSDFVSCSHRDKKNKTRSKIRTCMPHHTPRWTVFLSVSARRSSSCVFKHFQTRLTFSQYYVLLNSRHLVGPLVHINVEKGEGEKYERKWELCTKEVLFTMNAEVCNLRDASFDVKLFSLAPLCCLLCHLVRDPAQTPPAGTKWHLVCTDAKDELDIISRPCLPPIAQHIAPLGLISLGRACSETERADLILPAGRIMRNFGISSGSPSHLHSFRIECEENCRRGTAHLQNNPSLSLCHCQSRPTMFSHVLVKKVPVIPCLPKE